MYSGVNLLGLALSLACVITIFRYVYGEFTVDRFNKKIDRIYITTQERNDKQGFVRFFGIAGPDIDMKNHPGVEKYAHFICLDDDEIEYNDRKYNASVLAADSNFLKIVDFPIISGVEMLSEPKSALITRHFAQKLFGNQDPIGKTIKHSNGEILTITGIVGQLSTKSTLAFDIIISYHVSRIWNRGADTYVLLYPGVDYRTINKQYDDVVDQQLSYQLFPLSKVYFDKRIFNYKFKQGNHNYVIVLMAVGILILLVGVVNYINIFTVIILRRGRELGIKKVFGAGGHTIFIQLMIENLLMTGLALILAFFTIRITNQFITNAFRFDLILNIRFDILLSFALLLFLPLIATLYPFFRYHFSTVVKSIQNIDKIRNAGSLRRVFLSLQYIVSIVMIIVSLFFIKQFRFMLNTDPGYRTKDIIKAPFKQSVDLNVYSKMSQEEKETQQNKELQIKDEITQKINACPLFTYWTYGDSPNNIIQGAETSFRLPDGEYKKIKIIGADERWLRLFDIQLKEGRLWDDTKDSSQDYFLIVTESVLKQYGITDFNNALLQSESRVGEASLKGGETVSNLSYRIVGVVKDFDFLHLSQQSAPSAFCFSKKLSFYPLIASIVPGRKQEAIEFLKNLHDETVGGEFTYSFVEDEIREMYREDKKIATIYSIFTFIAIFVSILGLLSMSLFDIQQRRKEIAIRKINGATITDIIKILLKKYFLTLLISFVIAAPVALLAINRYLEDFAHKAPISWWLFTVAIIITAGISLLTLLWQTQKAAHQNPAEVVVSG
jgi:ABC-type antimicrobial peptide transport system permease subunit